MSSFLVGEGQVREVAQARNNLGGGREGEGGSILPVPVALRVVLEGGEGGIEGAGEEEMQELEETEVGFSVVMCSKTKRKSIDHSQETRTRSRLSANIGFTHNQHYVHAYGNLYVSNATV